MGSLLSRQPICQHHQVLHRYWRYYPDRRILLCGPTALPVEDRRATAFHDRLLLCCDRRRRRRQWNHGHGDIVVPTCCASFQRQPGVRALAHSSVDAKTMKTQQCQYKWPTPATTELGEERCHRGYERSSGPCSTFHFVQGNECNEFRIGDTLIPYVKKTGVFSAGTCASQGYTVAHGSKTTNLHQLAAEGRGVTVYIFERAATTELSLSSARPQ